MARPLLALVALDRAGLPDTDETLRVLGEIWRDAPRATDVKVTDDVITFRLDGHTAAISLQPEPIPTSRANTEIMLGVRGRGAIFRVMLSEIDRLIFFENQPSVGLMKLRSNFFSASPA